MWKDFFYYSKSERRAILTLISMGILLLIFGTWSNIYYQEPRIHVDSLSIDSFCVTTVKRYMQRDSLFSTYERQYASPKVHLADFDPNAADSVELRSLGLPSFLVRRIINYRIKGGVFKTADDFSRIYGLSEQQFERLKPYIVIREQSIEKMLGKEAYLSMDRKTVSKNKNLSYDSLKYRVYRQDSSLIKYPEGTVLDLNTVDTMQLKHVPGIGSGLARMIVSYRNKLGGYSSVNQLQEIGYIDTTINKWFHLVEPIYRPLRVNHANLDQLRNHPYMNFYKARTILEFRRKRGKIKGLSQLSMFQEFTEKDLQRLKPYLNFE